MLHSESQDIFIDFIKSYCAIPTIDYYKINMRLFNDFLIQTKGSIDIDIKTLTKHDYVSYITYLRNKKIKNTSVRTYARAIKVYLRFLYNEGYIDENITYHVKYPKPDKKMIIPLSNQQVDRLIEGINHSWMRTRNIFIFRLMLDCGLRCGEVVALNKKDIDLTNDCIHIINTKNNKSRIVPLPSNVRRCAIEYLTSRNDDNEALILNCDCTERITENGIKLVFSKLKRYEKDIHCHLLRHTFATSFIMGGGEMEILRVLMGHEDYAVTKEYLHIASQMGVIKYDIYKLDDIVFNRYIAYTPSRN